ncbi:S8 family serine peptidase [Actinoplanes solisilvae]|uniref:S8 family serine peptidase n=1 Tax=Actinoplanes solisilvae TaxID=2486853 RepID=UPI000FD8FC17|nr:S8 family serine peptidase [Actinoplanes solisilvae]
MRKHLRRYAVGALAIGAVAGGVAIALPATVTSAAEWQPAAEYTPATDNLNEAPEKLLPAAVSAEKPVRVVTTTLDANGKPVVKVTTATSKSGAAKAVKAGQGTENAVGVEVDAVVTATDAPTGTDTMRSRQWDFTKIRVADAWTKSTGAGVVVAVLDTGVDAKHPDLAANTLSGYDAIANKAGVSTDPNGHGTHVAGTIAAVTGNNVGISAVAPGVKILPVRVLNAKGSGFMSDTAEGIIWATDRGAKVINMSLGSSSQTKAVTSAITYARGKGVVVVAASGNDRAKGSPANYPAADAGVIGVGATDSADKIGTYSTAGSYVDVSAPGTGILSTYPTALGGKTGYASMNGTSMATPHVAAVAALLKAYQTALTPDQVQSALERSAVDLGAKGRDNDFGYGRIDAVAALQAVTPVTSPATTSPTTPATTSPATTAPAAPKPTTTAPATSPTIKITAAATDVVYGTSTTATYTVTAGGIPWAGKAVRFAVTPAATTKTTYVNGTTDANGKVVFSRTAVAHVQVRLEVPAADATVTSAATSFTVHSTATAASPSAGKVALAFAGPLGQKISFEKYENGQWAGFATATVDYAKTTYSAAILKSGMTVRIVVPGTTAVTGVTTAAVKIA